MDLRSVLPSLHHCTPRRQHRPTRLPPHHAPSAGSSTRRSRTKYRSEGLPHAASIEGMQARAVEVGCGPGQRPLREVGHQRDTTGRIPGTALVVRGGPGESRGLRHFSFLECCIGANFDNQNKTLLCYPGIVGVWHPDYASTSPTDFLYGSEGLLRSRLKPKDILPGRGLSLRLGYFCVYYNVGSWDKSPDAPPVIRNQLPGRNSPRALMPTAPTC
jgi:hypothetical protein